MNSKYLCSVYEGICTCQLGYPRFQTGFLGTQGGSTRRTAIPDGQRHCRIIPGKNFSVIPINLPLHLRGIAARTMLG